MQTQNTAPISNIRYRGGAIPESSILIGSRYHIRWLIKCASIIVANHFIVHSNSIALPSLAD